MEANYFLNCHTEEAVKIRWRQLALQYHPDRASKLGADKEKEFSEIMKLVNDERDVTLVKIYRRSGAAEDAIQERLREFTRTMNLKSLVSNGTAQSLMEKFQEKNPGVEIGFNSAGLLFRFVIGEIFHAEKTKNKTARPPSQDPKQLGK